MAWKTAQQEPPKERIDKTKGVLMTSIGFGLDSLQASIGIVPILGFIVSPIISLFIWFFFWTWFKLNGVSIGDSVERIAVMFGGFLVEMIPVLNILPAWTLTVFLTVLIVQRADRKALIEYEKNTIKESVPNGDTVQ
jgi:hypothetical protein